MMLKVVDMAIKQKSGGEGLEKWASLLKTIGNPTRLAILLILYANEEGSLTFTQLKEIMGLPSDSTLVHHLEILLKAKLIEKIACKEGEIGRVYPKYQISKLGKELLEQTQLAQALQEYMNRHPK
jgi:DNA-binding transcriptional ArsR family regulator